MNNWVKGLVFAVLFFVIIGLISNSVEDPYQAGANMGSSLLLVGLVAFGIYAGLRIKKKKENK